MAFIRRKVTRIDGGVVYQVVRSRRVDGKVRQEYITSLSQPTIAASIARVEEEIALHRKAGHYEHEHWRRGFGEALEHRRQHLVTVQQETGLP